MVIARDPSVMRLLFKSVAFLYKGATSGGSRPRWQQRESRPRPLRSPSSSWPAPWPRRRCPSEDCVDFAHAQPLARRSSSLAPLCARPLVYLDVMIRGSTQEAPTRLIAGSTRRHVRGALGCGHTPGSVRRRQEAPLAPAPPHAAGHLSHHLVPGALSQARLPVQAHEELPRALCAEGGMPAGLAPRSGAGQARVSVCVVPVRTGAGVDAASGGGTRDLLQELVRGAPGAAAGARGGARQTCRIALQQLFIGRYPVPLLGRCALPA